MVGHSLRFVWVAAGELAPGLLKAAWAGWMLWSLLAFLALSWALLKL